MAIFRPITFSAELEVPRQGLVSDFQLPAFTCQMKRNSA